MGIKKARSTECSIAGFKLGDEYYNSFFFRLRIMSSVIFSMSY